MKKVYFYIIAILVATSLNAQIKVSISAGVKMSHIEKKSVAFWFIDDSPSQDNIQTLIDPPGRISADLAVRIQNGKRFNWFIEGQGYFIGLNGLSIVAGILYSGKNPDGKFKVQPELGLVYGYSFKHIGTIHNNDIYIQVNDTKFKDHTDVEASLDNMYYGIKPGLVLAFNVGKQKLLGVKVCYQLSIKSSSIGFSGTTDDGKSARDSKKLKDPKVGFYVNGVDTDKSPYNPDGFEFKLYFKF